MLYLFGGFLDAVHSAGQHLIAANYLQTDAVDGVVYGRVNSSHAALSPSP